MKGYFVLILVVLLVLIGGYFWRVEQPQETKIEQEQEKDVEVVAQDLNIPWELVFINNEMLVTERPGRLIKIGQNREIIEVQGVAHIGEGGLLGLALHPDFKNNNLIYLYLTTRNGNEFSNRVERYKLDGNKLTNKKVIVEGILGSSIHDGGRIAFGPDGYLYIATGDAGNSNLAQDKKSLNGKILRVKDDPSTLQPRSGQVVLEIYSMGHRNVQGLAWDSAGRLWATEHGQSNLDELNLIEKGKNYGWPIIQGDETKEGMVSPVVHSGSDIWAPSGMSYANGSLFFAGLRGEALYEYKIKEGKLLTHFKNQYERLRTVVVGPSFVPLSGASAGKPDGFLYLLTNNRDGRGIPKEGDDKIIKVKIP